MLWLKTASPRTPFQVDQDKGLVTSGPAGLEKCGNDILDKSIFYDKLLNLKVL
jgi:hypothetical protein